MTEEELKLMKIYLQSPYLQFEPREDTTTDQMTTLLNEEFEGGKIILGGTGCHVKGTMVRMFDGTTKSVECIKIGDLVMGNDGTARKVIELHSGVSPLYRIKPKGLRQDYKGRFSDEIVVNENHILHLYRTSDKRDKKTKGGSNGREWHPRFHNHFSHKGNGVFEISVKDYIKESKKYKHFMQQKYADAIPYSKKQLKIDPYFLGVWLGDGSSHAPHITTADKEIVDLCYKTAKEYGLGVNIQYQKDNAASTYCLTRGNHSKNKNTLLNQLNEYNLIKDKHIPFDYKTSSITDRLELLAGLIDTDGHLSNGTYHSFTNKNKQLTFDVSEMARSLGIRTSIKQTEQYCIYKGEKRWGIYYKVSLFNDCHKIPVRIPRKKCPINHPKKNPLRFGIIVESVGEGEYYGFTLDGDGLFLLDNNIIQHNSAKTRTSCFLLAQTIYRNKPPTPNTPIWIGSQTLDMVGSLYSQALSLYLDKDMIDTVRWRKTNLHPEIIMLKKDEYGNSFNLHFFSYEMGRKALQSANVWMAYLDEQAPPEIIEEVWGRLRTWKHNNMFLYSLTPLEPDPWLQDIYDRKDEDEVKSLWRFYHLDTMANKHITTEWKKNYLDSLPPDIRLTRQYGQFASYRGAVYPEFVNELADKNWLTDMDGERFIGVDFGFHHPAAVWIIKKNDIYYVVDDMQLRDEMPDVFARKIKEKHYDHRWKVIVDYEDAISIKYLNQAGIVTTSARKNVVDGINNMKSLMFCKKFYVSKNCKETIKQLKSYQWKDAQKDKDAPDEVKKINDHLADCCRYVTYTTLKSQIKPWESTVGAKPIQLVKPHQNPLFQPQRRR